MTNVMNLDQVFNAHNTNQQKNEQFYKNCGIAGTVVGTAMSFVVAYHVAKKRYN